MPASPAGRNEPIRVGVLYALSGAGVAYGESARRGLELAVTEINRAGGMLGRPVEILLADEGKPKRGPETVRRLFREGGVNPMTGGDYPFRILKPVWTFEGNKITPLPEVGTQEGGSRK